MKTAEEHFLASPMRTYLAGMKPEVKAWIRSIQVDDLRHAANEIRELNAEDFWPAAMLLDKQADILEKP